jgi:general secretion pathway protein J
MPRDRYSLRGPRGVPLVEALVAIAILGIVALLAWRATAAMTDNEVRLAAETARWQRLDATLTRIEADLRAAVPRRARRGAMTEPAFAIVPEDSAGNTTLVFTRAGPDALDEPGIGGQRVAYRWRDGGIEVSYWPHIDNVADTVPSAYVLADGIARFRVTASTPDNRWFDRWPLQGGGDLPRGARIELTLADGSVVERWLALQ